MKYRTRIQYTETDKALMWERWREGESLQAIAQLFDRNHSAIGGILVRTGGIRPSPRCDDVTFLSHISRRWPRSGSMELPSTNEPDQRRGHHGRRYTGADRGAAG